MSGKHVINEQLYAEATYEAMSYEEKVQLVLTDAAIVQEKSDKLINQFYIDHDQADLFSIINLIMKKGNPKNKSFLEDFMKKYEGGEIGLQEIGRYNDLYDQHKALLVKGGK